MLRRTHSTPAPVKSALAPLRLLHDCGAPLVSDTAFVLILTPATESATEAHTVRGWNRYCKGKLSSASFRCLTQVKDVLKFANIPSPAVPKLFLRLSTPEEVMQEVEGIASRLSAEAATLFNTAANEFITTVQRGVDDELQQHEQNELVGAALHRLAAAMRRTATASATTSDWSHILDPHTGCLSRGSDNNSRRETDPSPNRHETARCVLRLSCLSPLTSLFVQHHLLSLCNTTTQHAPATSSTPPPAATSPYPPKARIELQQYKPRYVMSDLIGFRFGPITPGKHEDCDEMSEPHGNWQRLRDFLLEQAPNCYPSSTCRSSHGHAAVRFAHDEKYTRQLERLVADKKSTYPDFAIDKPLQLTLETAQQAAVTACSACGLSGHSAKACTTYASTIKTCRQCYSPGHLVAQCPKAVEELKCGICAKTGHSTTSCRQYKTKWTTATSNKPNATSSLVRTNISFAAAARSVMIGEKVPQPATTAALRPAIDTSNDSFPALPQPQRQKRSAQPATAPAHNTQPAAAQPASSELTEMREIVASMQKQIQTLLDAQTKQAEAAEKRAEEAAKREQAAAAREQTLHDLMRMLIGGHRPLTKSPDWPDHHDSTHQHTTSPTSHSTPSPANSTASTSSQSSSASLSSLSSEAGSSHTQHMDMGDNAQSPSAVTAAAPHSQHSTTADTTRRHTDSRHTGDTHASTANGYVHGDVNTFTPTYNIGLPPQHTQSGTMRQQQQLGQAPPSYHAHIAVHAPADQSSQ